MSNPSAAILVIGDEILSGRTRDSNLHYLSCELTKIGINLQEARIVPDNATEIINAVKNKSVDTVVSAVVGYSGLEPTISAIEAGKNIALANKETLVVAGELINNLIKKYKVKMYPIDSEHSAIYQCILGEEKNKFENCSYRNLSGGIVAIHSGWKI